MLNSNVEMNDNEHVGEHENSFVPQCLHAIDAKHHGAHSACLSFLWPQIQFPEVPSRRYPAEERRSEYTWYRQYHHPCQHMCSVSVWTPLDVHNNSDQAAIDILENNRRDETTDWPTLV